MNAYVTIATSTYPSETAVIEGKLESERIKCVLHQCANVIMRSFNNPHDVVLLPNQMGRLYADPATR